MRKLCKTNDRADITKRKILNAAKKEFALRGFDGARMESIAKTAKVNKAMIHYYFNSKDELYEKVLYALFFVGGVEKNIIDEFKDIELNPPQGLYLAIYSIVYLHLEVQDDMQHQILAWEMAGGRKFLKRVASEILVPRTFHLEEVIKAGIENKDFYCEDPLFMVWSFLSLIHFYTTSKETFEHTEIGKRLYGRYDCDSIARQIALQVFRSLKPEGKSLELPFIEPEILQKLKTGVKQTIEESKDSSGDL